MSKKLISAQNIKEAAKKGQKSILISKDTIITSAALDTARSLKVEIIQETTPNIDSKVEKKMIEKKKYNGKIAIGSDHGGYQLKEQLKPYIESMGFSLIDIGTSSEEACDYPDFAFAVAKLVSTGEAEKGIMIDAVGIASAMVANKIPGIRAAVCQNEFTAKSSREHNDANILTLGGRILGVELAKSIVDVWLTTQFAAGRHQKRVDKISDIDLRYRNK